MEIDYTPEIDWNSDDTLAFRNFLRTQAGSKLLGKLAQSTPVLLPEGDINSILIRSGEVRGLQEAVRALYALAFPMAPVKSEPRTEYKPLDSDEDWNDGQKLIPETPDQTS
jgi:hypothetical protein